MGKPSKLMLGLLVLGTVVGVGLTQFGTGTSQVNQTVVAHAATTVNAKNQGMVGDGKTDNAPLLQRIINAYSADDNVTIHVPKGNYLFTNAELKAIVLHSNITFNFDKDAVFQIQNGDRIPFVYPSPEAGYDGGISNVTWNNATFRGDYNKADGQSVFVQSINHASNVNFNDCTFDNAESPTGHYIDIDGSHDVNVKGSTFTGFNASSNFDYKEAIQVDYSNTKAMSYHESGDKYDNLPSYDVTVDHNNFIPLSNTSGSVKSFAPNPIGEHVVYGKGAGGIIHDIHFTNNYVQDAKPLLSDDGANIHFVCVSNLYISNNTFENKNALGSGNYIRIFNTSPIVKMSNIQITNNNFVNLDPNNRYIYFDNSKGGGITGVVVTGNKITSAKSNIPFVLSNGMSSSDMQISKNTNNKQAKIKATDINNTAKLKKLTGKYKGNKATNKKESYVSGYASQYAKLAANVAKKYGLYSHIKGHAGWYIYNKKDGFANMKKSRMVYVDMRATADSGKWYRIRFSSSANARKYWIRASALKFDKITYESYERTLTPLKKYTMYTKVFDDPQLAKLAGTTADLGSKPVQITQRARRVSVLNGKTSTYYLLNGKYWTRAVAFY
ncbi:N-acetylmuramoyl-L-alanine amidase [Secundilactobacillus folii]|uniref:N-acetylmuramoyl-L-alanine amidase n=1 Tax=Secundilactobacillus folii TaxID=2678357 RepID=A0A7X2XV64_9LACO|nr:N-acetylmuramoyl-L-alanine amidase [Secundilactobacillus folii]MTV81655.1 N-acetylmuramoyl-L-alanine amidase [Secundilactobacillus folii]